MTDDVERLRHAYPQIWFACHVRHRGRGDAGLTEREASTLSHLATSEGTSLSALARHLGLAASTLSEVLRRLEREGWVHVVVDVGDRRRRRASVTEKGRRALDDMSGLDSRRVAALLDRIEPDARQRALEGLEVLAQAAMRIRSENEEG